MIVCDVCKGSSEPFFHNKALLGADDVLCHDCFLLWYEQGVTSRDDMRQRRQVSSPLTLP